MTTPVASIPGGLQLTLHLLDAGQPAAIVLGGKGGGAWTDTSGVEAWRDAAWTAFRGLMMDTVVCTGATARNLQATTDLPIEVPAPALPGGTNGGTRALSAASSLIKWSTAVGGRSGKGRTFLPGLNSVNVSADGRTYSSAHRSNIATQANNYLSNSALAAEGIQPAIISRKQGQAYVITSAAAATIVGVQRRRMRA